MILIKLILLTIIFPYMLFCQTDYCPCCKEQNQKALASSIIETFHLYNCTDETIAKSLGKEPCNKLAQRLKNYVCRLIKKGKDKKSIIDALMRRGQSMVKLGQAAVIDTKESPVVGELDAPIILVVYTCARCPFCRVIIPKLYNSVIKKELKGKVKLYVRIFPIRGHKGSVPGGLAFEAAREMDKFFEYMLLAYKDFDNFSESKLEDWAEKLNMPVNDFKEICKAPSTREKLIASKKEGLANGVKATPTFFINGRIYLGDMDIATMTDVLEEEFEQIIGKYLK